MTSAEARFNQSLRPRKPEGSLGRTAQDVYLDSHTAPELCLDWFQRNLTSGAITSYSKHTLSSSFASPWILTSHQQHRFISGRCQVGENQKIRNKIESRILFSNPPLIALSVKNKQTKQKRNKHTKLKTKTKVS